MAEALRLARQAYAIDEVPVGAAVVLDGEIIGKGFNRCVSDNDPSAHAEVLALREAGASQKQFRLDGATMYVTLEPCLMCCGALLQARIARLVYSVREPRTGAVVSVHECLRQQGVDHHIAISEGALSTYSEVLLKEFFKSRR